MIWRELDIVFQKAKPQNELSFVKDAKAIGEKAYLGTFKIKRTEKEITLTAALGRWQKCKR